MGLKRQLLRTDVKCNGLFPDAYFKIDNVRLEEGKVRFRLRGYCDQVARKMITTTNDRPMPNENASHIYEEDFSCQESELPVAIKTGLTATDMLKHCCYLWLKAQSKFAAATDSETV